MLNYTGNKKGNRLYSSLMMHLYLSLVTLTIPFVLTMTTIPRISMAVLVSQIFFHFIVLFHPFFPLPLSPNRLVHRLALFTQSHPPFTNKTKLLLPLMIDAQSSLSYGYASCVVKGWIMLSFSIEHHYDLMYTQCTEQQSPSPHMESYSSKKSHPSLPFSHNSTVISSLGAL